MKRKFILFHYYSSFIVLFLHELSHILMGLLFFKMTTSIKFEKGDPKKYKNGIGYTCIVNVRSTRFIITGVLIQIAPVFMTIGLFIFGFYNTFFLYFLIPFFIAHFKQFFPSRIDMENVKYLIKSEEEKTKIALTNYLNSIK